MAIDVNSSRGKYWIVFFVFLAIMVYFLIVDPTWFWLPLPFVLTFFVKAIDYM